MNPLEVIRAKFGEGTDAWIYKRIKKCGAHETESFLWNRVSEVDAMTVEEMEKHIGSGEHFGEET